MHLKVKKANATMSQKLSRNVSHTSRTLAFKAKGILHKKKKTGLSYSNQVKTSTCWQIQQQGGPDPLLNTKVQTV